MPSQAVLAALAKAEADLALLRQMIEAEESGTLCQEVMPVKEAAFVYGVSERTMQRMANADGLKIGGKSYVFPRLIRLPARRNPENLLSPSVSHFVAQEGSTPAPGE